MPPDPALAAEKLYEISSLGSLGEWVVANNPFAPVELLDTLAKSNDWQVRMFVARNSGAGLITLAQLEKDTVEEVRQTVGKRR
ncbi:hypothetical protein ACFLXI_00460 [Chloroflexota bacterium]